MKRLPIERTPEELFATLFQRAAAEPLAWRLTAESLVRAARILLPSIEERVRATLAGEPLSGEPPSTGAYMLLIGLAAENLVKGILVARHDGPTSAGMLAKDLKSHQLLDLLNRAGVRLDDDQSYLVQRLEVFVVWAGRYPVPGKLDDYLPRRHETGGWGPLTGFYSSDPARVDKLIALLVGELNCAGGSEG
jgi:hypothetical protein